MTKVIAFSNQGEIDLYNLDCIKMSGGFLED
jgi:hypothetical protein